MTDTRGDMEPYENQPVRHPNGQMLPYRCEVHVYSNARWDMGGHQCGNIARWRIPDFDKWGDIIVCGRHKDGRDSRSTHLHTLFGQVAGEPQSWRFERSKRPVR